MHPVIRNIFITAMIVTTTLACSKQTAEEKGKEMATEKIDMVKGIGDALVEKGNTAAESLSHGTGKVLQGTQSGFDKAFSWKANLGAGMQQAGLDVTQLQRNTSDAAIRNRFDVYFVANQNALGTVQVIAYDQNQKELARVKHELNIQAQDARYETLALDERVPMENISAVSFEFFPKTSETTVQR